MANDPQSKGTLIRGADGSLYYIPDDKMQAFKLPDHKTEEARAMLDEQGITAHGNQVPAMCGEGLVKKTDPDDFVLAVDTKKLKSITEDK
jgi:DNA-directed RNA polymerase beta subunit